MNDKHREQFDEEPRDEITEEDFTEAMEQMLSSRTSVRFENKEPTKEELEKRFKLRRALDFSGFADFNAQFPKIEIHLTAANTLT